MLANRDADDVWHVHSGHQHSQSSASPSMGAFHYVEGSSANCDCTHARRGKIFWNPCMHTTCSAMHGSASRQQQDVSGLPVMHA